MDSHLYVNRELGFSVRKPESWTFLPTPWAVKLRSNLDPSTEELQRIMQLASTPFVSAYLPRTDPTSPFPTLQVTCRVVARKVEPRSLLQPVLASLRSQFDDLEILESSADAIVAGRPATLVKARFSVHELRVRGSRESRRLCWVGRATKKSLRMSGDSTRLDPLKEFRRLYLEPTAHREMLTPSTAVLDTLSPGERVVAEKELLGELETRVVDQRVLLALGHFRTEAAVPTLQQHLRKSKQDPTNPRRGCPVGHLP